MPKNNLTTEELAYYDRHLNLKEVGAEGQKRLKDASVLLVGLGGLGSPLSLYLAGAGVGRIGIVEFDKVDKSNLHRQVIYNASQVGHSKLRSGIERLRNLNPNVEIIGHEKAFSEDNARALVKDYQIVADGCDNFSTRYLVNDACVLEDRPFVSASVFRFEGQLSLFHYQDGPCYRCLYPEPPPEGSVPSCTEGGVLGVLPGILGTLQALEVIKVIIQQGELLSGRLLHFDALAGKFSQFKFAKDPKCAACSAQAPIKDAREMKFSCASPSVVASISRDELSHFLKTGNQDFVLVDVREDEERELQAIQPSLHIKLANILSGNYAPLPKDKNIVLYCRSGARSLKAAEYLSRNGYAKVHNLRGGILEFFQ